MCLAVKTMCIISSTSSHHQMLFWTNHIHMHVRALYLMTFCLRTGMHACPSHWFMYCMLSYLSVQHT